MQTTNMKSSKSKVRDAKRKVSKATEKKSFDRPTLIALSYGFSPADSPQISKKDFEAVKDEIIGATKAEKIEYEQLPEKSEIEQEVEIEI